MINVTLNIVIITLILAGLTLHRYLSAFWEQGQLPSPSGFLFFANFFALVYLVSFIWMFGWIPGTILALLCYLQAVYSAGLWVFSLPSLISTSKGLNLPRVNKTAYGGFSLIVIAVAVLTLFNVFISPYESVWESIDDHRWTVGLVFVGLLIIGNVARVVIMSKVLKQ